VAVEHRATDPFAALGSPVGRSLFLRIYSLPHLSSAEQSGRPEFPMRRGNPPGKKLMREQTGKAYID